MAALTRHPVYRSLNRPLTIWGAERRLFFVAVVMGGATLNAFQTFSGGLLMFCGPLCGGPLGDDDGTRRFSEFLSIRRGGAVRYDPGKYEPIAVEVRRTW